jgi:hypothetical protein
MNKSILTIAIASLISTAAFATGNEGGTTVGSTTVTVQQLGSQDIDLSSASATVGTEASGAVTQGYHVGNFVSSGSFVITGSSAKADADLYREPHASASGISGTAGAAWGNGNASYLGFSGASATDAVGHYNLVDTTITTTTIVAPHTTGGRDH